ncbi:MAG: response regulator transcription factor [Puniceicoccales bacterium]|jgi:DNA-binding response OmpR family regulator|nr:response regulator transcription factor [Puniceicoccales bacterium]
MSHYRILVVEDDAAIRRGMADTLKFVGHDVLEAATGPDGLAAALNNEYDLLLLDIVLPGGVSGLDILGQLQNERPGTPVILLTAKGAEADRVAGLKLGADDYVVKPFSVKELVARIEAVLRRSPGRTLDRRHVAIPGGTADFERRLVQFDKGGETPLTEREYELFRYLATHPGRIITRDEILQRIWKLDPRAVETRTIDMTIARLRDKIRDRNCTIIQTIRGRGYQFTGPPAP